jgi:hypothetical protein
VRPDVAPSAPVKSAGRSVVGVVALRGPQRPLGRALGVSSGRDGNRTWPGRPPRVKLGTVGDAHEVAISRSLEFQAPELDFESSWEGVRAAHGVSLAPVLSADHHRDGWWELNFGARPPTWRANCRCGK